jgi:hypothetical protein
MVLTKFPGLFSFKYLSVLMRSLKRELGLVVQAGRNCIG